VKPGGGIQPYLDDGLDLPELEVQSIKSDQNYDMTNCNGDRQAHNLKVLSSNLSPAT